MEAARALSLATHELWPHDNAQALSLEGDVCVLWRKEDILHSNLIEIFLRSGHKGYCAANWLRDSLNKEFFFWHLWLGEKMGVNPGNRVKFSLGHIWGLQFHYLH
jgi:hypothetical protein